MTGLKILELSPSIAPLTGYFTIDNTKKEAIEIGKL